MNLTMFKRLATDVAPPIAALLVLVAIALWPFTATGDDRSHSRSSALGPIPSHSLEPNISKRPVALGLEVKSPSRAMQLTTRNGMP
jgi:hypothetical protein